MSSRPTHGTGSSPDSSFVEINSTSLSWRDGRVQSVTVRADYYSPNGAETSATVEFEVDETGHARFIGFEDGCTSLRDLRTVPAAEMVVRSVDGVESVQESLHALEDELEAGHQAVDNRLEMTNVPQDLQDGYETR